MGAVMVIVDFIGLIMVEAFGNIGIALGFTFIPILLLRPVTNRILRPKYRVWGWIAACMGSYTWSIYAMLGYVHLLPVTFRGWISPKVDVRGRPVYIPDLTELGETVVTVPGGVEIPFTVTETIQNVVGLSVTMGIVLTFLWMLKQEREIKRIYRDTPAMDAAWHAARGIDYNEVQVHIIEGLPTSFVCRVSSFTTHICLQKELPEEQMELVLRHEIKHIEGRHVWLKGILMMMLYFYWWNPIMWVAYRLVCRDMELACDEAVLAELDERQRRTYAHTLVELASGKPMWGGLTCFGESDAALRVKNVVQWKRGRKWTWVIVLPVMILVFLFLYTSPAGTQSERNAAWERYIAEELEEDFDAPGVMSRSGDILEVRVQHGLYGKELLIYTDNDRWYQCGVKWYPEYGRYRINYHKIVEDGSKYQNFIPIEGWG